MVSRQHRRVRMRLPARLRWTTPLGQKIELAETRDVSRGGLLVASRDFHAAGVEFWVTFPHNPSLGEGQPEVLARVVRCVTSSEGGQHPAVAAPFVLAIDFLGPARTNGNRGRPVRERRGSPRRLLAVPIRVRPAQVPWFEETMSLDFSPRGMRFRSYREYAVGEVLGITFEDPSPASWRRPVEFRAKVVRVFPAADGARLDVAVCRAT
jgi:hypothetical protein